MMPFDRLECDVRSYCRTWPVVFRRARGSILVDEEGREYVDFFAGAGALNYGHNDPDLKEALVAYLLEDGVTHSLDMATTAKRDFLLRFEELVLEPRGLEYRMLFPGPTGTNAIEAALKIARAATGRTGVVAFTNGFHGMTLGALALTGNRAKRAGAGVPLEHVRTMPYDGYLGEDVDTIAALETLLDDPSSGLEPPAAFVVETVQAEGGVNVASDRWLQRLSALADDVGALLIVDDIQVGCGRTGPFFSFEACGVVPDVVCLSKSLSGFGLPMAMVLVRPNLDVLEPGQHNGTFRGHMPAFVTATRALDRWRTHALTMKVESDAEVVQAALQALAEGRQATVRGRGLIQGLAIAEPGLARDVVREAFARGLVIETAGARDEVVKVLPPLVIEPEVLDRGLAILADAVTAVVRRPRLVSAPKGTGQRTR